MQSVNAMEIHILNFKKSKNFIAKTRKNDLIKRPVNLYKANNKQEITQII